MWRANEGVKRYWNTQEAASIDRNAPRQTAVPPLDADIHRAAVKAEKIETTKSPTGWWAEFAQPTSRNGYCANHSGYQRDRGCRYDSRADYHAMFNILSGSGL